VAQVAAVRKLLVAEQQSLAALVPLVMEGRDIGTVVFPSADVKIYLDASPDERARRRALDPSHEVSRRQGSVQSVAEALAARDASDRTRKASPLVRAADALYIDTTGAAVDDVVARVIEEVDRRHSGSAAGRVRDHAQP
jgi:cytidylate kinase